MDIVTTARKIATAAHKGQFRDDGKTPYITHPEAVANAVRCEHQKAVAWLHDVIEDTSVTRDDLLSAGLPVSVVDDVSLLTRTPDQNYLDYLIAIIDQSGHARVVKIEDIMHNISTLNIKNKNERRRIEKYELALYILRNS